VCVSDEEEIEVESKVEAVGSTSWMEGTGNGGADIPISRERMGNVGGISYE
jgi:hypothetical protein